MRVRKNGLGYEFKDLLKNVYQILFFLVVKTKVQIP